MSQVSQIILGMENLENWKSENWKRRLRPDRVITLQLQYISSLYASSHASAMHNVNPITTNLTFYHFAFLIVLRHP